MPRLVAGLVIVLGVVLSLGVGSSPVRAGDTGLSDPSALEVWEGTLTVTEDGAVIENLEIRGSLRIAANNVLVRNVWVYTSGPWTVYVQSGSATFEDIEIGSASAIGERGIGGDNVTVRRANIHHVEDGIKLGSNATYSDVWVHSLASLNATPHADAVQVEGSVSNSVVKNSVLDATGPVGGGNAAVIVKSDLGAQRNISFLNNYLNGGAYTIFVRDGGYGMPSNIAFKNNRFGPVREWGFLSKDGPVIWENNTLASTGEQIGSDGQITGPTTTTQPPTTTTTTQPPTTTTTTTTGGTRIIPPATPTTTTTTQPPTTTTTTTTTTGGTRIIPPATTTTTGQTTTTTAQTTTTTAQTTTTVGATTTTASASSQMIPSSGDSGPDGQSSESTDPVTRTSPRLEPIHEPTGEISGVLALSSADSDGVDKDLVLASMVSLLLGLSYITLRMSRPY